MSRFFVILKRPLLALVLFLLFQAMGGVFVLLVQMFSGEGSLLENVSDKVFENSGIRLEPEVRIW